MSKISYLITGATGKTGMALTKSLLQSGYHVRALAHREDERSNQLKALGAEIVYGDLFDLDDMYKALIGIQRAYYVPPFTPDATQAATIFSIAAQRTGLETIVQMSQWLSNPHHPSPLTREIYLIDEIFSSMNGVTHIKINPGMFADNFLRVMDLSARLGVFPVLTGSSKSAPVSNEDMAKVVAALLKNPEPYRGKTLRPTGPELLSGKDMARIVASVVGHPVLPMPMPFWLFNKAARWSGASLYEIYNYKFYMEDHIAGAFSVGGGVTTVVQDLTGLPAESFQTTAERYAAMPFASTGLISRVKEFAKFMVTPMLPGFNLRKFETNRQLPGPSTLSLSMQDEAWLKTHNNGIYQAVSQNGSSQHSYMKGVSHHAIA